jgi:hypothetical protein
MRILVYLAFFVIPIPASANCLANSIPPNLAQVTESNDLSHPVRIVDGRAAVGLYTTLIACNNGPGGNGVTAYITSGSFNNELPLNQCRVITGQDIDLYTVRTGTYVYTGRINYCVAAVTRKP